MSRKKPQLQLEVAPPEEKGVSITDTLTLVVKGDGGVEMRVKDSGLTPATQAPKTATNPISPAVGSEAILNKLKFEDLRIGPELGKGSQGKVRVVQHRQTLEKFALKYLNFEGDQEAQRTQLQAELKQIEALKHDNIVSSYEAFFRDGKLYIVLEYMDCGTMNDLIKRHPKDFSEENLAFVARSLLRGLQHLHKSLVVHRDIKPANVLCNSKGEVKISDFGVAKTLTGNDMQTLSSQGSVPYMSPERIQSMPYSFSCDIWSAGLTIAECALGTYPFPSLKSKLFDLCQKLTSSNIKIDWTAVPGKNPSDELKDFVAACLKPADSRPTAQELLDHPFIAKAEKVDPIEAGKWFLEDKSKDPQ